MEISVIICTYNRSNNLPECADCLARQEGMAGITWEIVIVDNNSNDDTANRVVSLQNEHAVPIRYLFEEKQGLSHARNCGINNSDGRYVIFIDDDIHVYPGWLKAIFDGFETHSADVVGGRILVDSPIPIPDWIQPEMYGFLGQRDFGDTPFIMDGITQFPFGGNMAISRSMIGKAGLFNTDMGRKGEGRRRQELFKGEETDYFHRVRDAGGVMFYAPGATVSHVILPHQLEKKFFRALHFNAGYQKAYLDTETYRRAILGVPVFLFRQLLSAVFSYLWKVPTQGISRAFRQQMTVGYFLGMINGYYTRGRG